MTKRSRLVMTQGDKEMLMVYLNEILSIATTTRIGKVLVSPYRALEEIASNVNEAINILNND